MEDQTYEEELGKLERSRKRGFIASAGLYAVALGVTLLSDVLFPNIEEPKVLRDYDNAKVTLARLDEARSKLALKLDLPYETPKIQRALEGFYDVDRARVSVLDTTIAEVKADRTKMERSPQFIGYCENQNQQAKKRKVADYGVYVFLAVAGINALRVGLGFNNKRKKLRSQRLHTMLQNDRERVDE